MDRAPANPADGAGPSRRPARTARHALSGPAGSARNGPGEASAARAAYAIALAGLAGGLAWAATTDGHVRAGCVIMACALLGAALARLVLPDRAAGLLVSRRRLADVLALATLGACVLIAALALPAPS